MSDQYQELLNQAFALEPLDAQKANRRIQCMLIPSFAPECDFIQTGNRYFSTLTFRTLQSSLWASIRDGQAQPLMSTEVCGKVAHDPLWETLARLVLEPIKTVGWQHGGATADGLRFLINVECGPDRVTIEGHYAPGAPPESPSALVDALYAAASSRSNETFSLEALAKLRIHLAEDPWPPSGEVP